jgi:hypothetical protein
MVDGTRIRGDVRASSPESLTIRTGGQERLVDRAAIRKVSVPDNKRRILWGMIGVAAGAAAGLLACPQCGNEGSPEITTMYGSIGAAAGATAFLIPAFRTIYERNHA